MRPIWRTLTAMFLFALVLIEASTGQPHISRLASASSFTATASTAGQPDVGIHVETVGAAFMPGDLITFTLTLSNSGTDIASGIIVTDVVPSQVLMINVMSTLEITATSGITYSWNVEPLSPGEGGVITLTGQIDPALPGDFSFTNVAIISDPDDITSNNNTSQVHIGKYIIFLSNLSHNWPPVPGTPILNSISNPSRNYSYSVSWTASANADTYTVQRDTAQDFLNPTVVYDGSALFFWERTINAAGTYYYRVRANNSWGNHSQWSNSISTLVGYADVWIYNETGSTITIEIVGVARRNFAPGTYMWLTIPWGSYTFNTWTSQYYYHVTYQIDLATFNLHIGS